MTTTSEALFISKLADLLRGLGYDATEKPDRMPNRSAWKDTWDALLGEKPRRPDILVERDGKFIVVEAKARRVLTASVVLARQRADSFGTDVVLCVPDEFLPEIPLSVKVFAENNDVALCSESEIGRTLRKVLT